MARIKAVTVMVRWGTSQLSLRRVAPPRPVKLRESAREAGDHDVVLPLGLLGLAEDTPLLEIVAPGEVVLRSWPGASLTFEAHEAPQAEPRSPYRATEEAPFARLRPGDVARLTAGALSIEVHAEAETMAGRGAPLPARLLGLGLLSAAAHATALWLAEGQALREATVAAVLDPDERAEHEERLQRRIKLAADSHENELNIEDFGDRELAEQSLQRRRPSAEAVYFFERGGVDRERVPSGGGCWSEVRRTLEEQRFDPPRDLDRWMTDRPWEPDGAAPQERPWEGDFSFRLWPERLPYLAGIGQNQRKEAWFDARALYPVLWSPGRGARTGQAVRIEGVRVEGPVEPRWVERALWGELTRLRFCAGTSDPGAPPRPRRYRVSFELDRRGKLENLVLWQEGAERGLDRAAQECAAQVLRAMDSLPAAQGIATVTLLISLEGPGVRRGG